MALYEAQYQSHQVVDQQKKDGTGTYKQLVLNYLSNGEQKTKKVTLSFITRSNPNLMQKLAVLAPNTGIIVETEGQFHQLKNVYTSGEALPGEVTKPKPKNEFMGNKGYQPRPHDPAKEKSIIRQSCLKVAAQLLHGFGKRDTLLQDVKNLTLELEQFVAEANTAQPKVTPVQNTHIQIPDFNDNEEPF